MKTPYPFLESIYTSLLEMRYLPMEKLTKSISKHFIDEIINGHDPTLKNVSVIKKKMNITDGKNHQYNKNSISNNIIIINRQIIYNY